MEFSVPKEVRDLEMRVGLVPAGVQALTQAGQTVYVERNAGAGAGFRDEEYRRAGATIVHSPVEAYGRADIVLKVTRPSAREHPFFRPGQAIFSFLHLSVSSPDLCQVMLDQGMTAVAYELVEDEDGIRPLLLPMSEITGRLAPIIAGQLLMSTHNGGGRGALLSGIPGVPAAAVIIIGGGVLGSNAARAFLGLGAQVTILDQDIAKLQRIDEVYNGRVTTMLSNDYNLKRVVEFADVLVGAILTPGRRAPLLVSRDMVRRMRPGSAIIDFAIDQGGCIETSRPTTLRDQTYVEEHVIHHCVPNITAAVARTASHALSNAVQPYLLAVAAHGLDGALNLQPALRRGLAVCQGKLTEATQT
jgi:alanine dehydrogenase